MAKRDMEQTADKMRGVFLKNKYMSHYSMNIDELAKLLKMCYEGQYLKAIDTAFYYGFVLGTRAHNKKHVSAL